jgi:hypothetical protein
MRKQRRNEVCCEKLGWRRWRAALDCAATTVAAYWAEIAYAGMKVVALTVSIWVTAFALPVLTAAALIKKACASRVPAEVFELCCESARATVMSCSSLKVVPVAILAASFVQGSSAALGALVLLGLGVHCADTLTCRVFSGVVCFIACREATLPSPMVLA